MNEVTTWQIWMRRFAFLALGMTFVLWKVVPLDNTPGQLPGPDIFYCITMCYIVRRPEYAPMWLIFAVFFMRDVLTMAPLGLFTLLMVVGSELVRANLQAFREYIFALEWLWVSAIFTVIIVLQQISLVLTFSPIPRFGDQLWLILFTVLCYPICIGIMRIAFGIKRPRPGETDAWGRRL